MSHIFYTHNFVALFVYDRYQQTAHKKGKKPKQQASIVYASVKIQSYSQIVKKIIID